MRKHVALILTVILTLSSLIMVNPSLEITKPSIPEFTLKYVDNSYDVPPTTTTKIDPYTGNKTVMTQAGYHVSNRSIEVIIMNQPFTPYTDANGHYINLAYAVRWKGHYSDSWNNLPNRTAYFGATNSKYTSIVFGLDWKENPGIRGNKDFYYDYYLDGVPTGGQVDFQVQAAIGYSELVPMPRNPFHDNDYYMIYRGQTSDWSSIQTITINDNSVYPDSPSPSATTNPSNSLSEPTTTPQQSSIQSGAFFGLDWEQIALILLGAAVLVLAFALVFSLRKSTKQTSNAV
ncbi:MAG: hypothetical protein NWE96_04225 [Candidatus Bathyarchaeota archaeon]|nr:hypothetical protein [Candidatus Bathyarchaeota archaeon]